MLLKPRRPATLGPVSKHLWSAQGAVAPTLQMPLRDTQRLQRIAPDGTLQERRTVFYHQPFSTTDLLNWKHHTPLIL